MRRLLPPAAFGAVALGLALVPAAKLPAFYESFLYLVFHWVALATSWTILSGFSGYFSFGHGAFFGAGIYTTATLATAGWPFLLTLPAAGLVAGAACPEGSTSRVLMVGAANEVFLYYREGDLKRDGMKLDDVRGE